MVGAIQDENKLNGTRGAESLRAITKAKVTMHVGDENSGARGVLQSRRRSPLVGPRGDGVSVGLSLRLHPERVEKKEAMGLKASNPCDQKTESGFVSRRARASRRLTTC
jgi:hypothetical protein